MELLSHIVLFAVGAVAGTALDHLHVAGGVLGYPSPAFWGEAPWVPPLFGGAALSFVLLWRLGFRGAEPRWQSPRRVALYFADFAVAYGASVALRGTPWLALAVLAAGWLPLALRLGPRVAAYGVTVAVLGVAVEALLCREGAFHYEVAGLMGPLPVPVWLAGLYLHASLLTRAIDTGFFAPRAGRLPA